MQGSHTVLNIASAKHTVVISWYTSMANPSFPSDSFSGFYGNGGYQFFWGGLTAYLLSCARILNISTIMSAIQRLNVILSIT